jgi:aldose 1-epimerase
MQKPYANLQAAAFNAIIDGRPVSLYSIRNRKGTLIARITNYGGKMVQLLVPDRFGTLGDVVLGWETIAETRINSPSAGAIIGRYANRIAGGILRLDSETYQLTVNDGANRPNCIHGGKKGSRFVVFDARVVGDHDLELQYLFKDGEEGFPGNCLLTVRYTLTDQDELYIRYYATTDHATAINFTQHNFWNLTGPGHPTILDHELQINADRFTPVDQNLVPTGELSDVKDTPFDFRTKKKIGRDIDGDHPQLRRCDGYDINFVLDNIGNQLNAAATVIDPVSGRVMEVLTTEPGLQLFSGNSLPKDGSLKGKCQSVYAYRGAFCLETQHFPDSPNHLHFPSTILRPGETYTSTTIYRFRNC